MKKIRFRSMDAIGYHPLELPRLNLDTVAFWIRPEEAARAAVRVKGLNPAEGLSGLRNLLITLLPLHVMCDRPDLGGILNSSNLGEQALFVYDRYPGGLGYAERGYAIVEELLRAALALVEDCPCESGCPSCVGPEGNTGPHAKAVASRILDDLLRVLPDPALSAPDAAALQDGF